LKQGCISITPLRDTARHWHHRRVVLLELKVRG
jgi:hypothetical protein